jgi:nitrite reductase/ring-hydroxylating ferredoxin subunit/multimeric flavodoxin WrbA
MRLDCRLPAATEFRSSKPDKIMAPTESWVDIGSAEELAQAPLRSGKAGTIPIAISFKDGQFGAVSNVCNHAGGPLGEGRLDHDYITCPWHGWKFHRCTGVGEPGFEQDRVPAFPVKVESGRVLVNVAAPSRRMKAPHAPHPLARKVERASGPLRLAGISTTVMDMANPRFSGSDHLLNHAITAAGDLGAQTRLIRLNDLKFRACEGYYSKAAQACTWPCSITQMDATDELDRVYEALVHWADAVIVASPIRWGTASSLYFKMVERMNCIQNQITINNRMLIRNKVAGFIIVGGQDNVQMVAGQMLGFFAELGFIFPQFPYVAHSRGWSHEDMENNVAIVRSSQELAEGAQMLAKRLLDLAGHLIAQDEAPAHIERGGRKAHPV